MRETEKRTKTDGREYTMKTTEIAPFQTDKTQFKINHFNIQGRLREHSCAGESITSSSLMLNYSSTSSMLELVDQTNSCCIGIIPQQL